MQAGLPCKGRSRVSTLHRPREPQAAAARFAVARQIARGDYWYLPQIRVPHQKARYQQSTCDQSPSSGSIAKLSGSVRTDHSCTPLGRAPRRGRSARDKSVRLLEVPLANARTLGGDRMDRAEQLEEAARLIWHSRAVSCCALSGHEHHASTTETAHAMALLYALTKL